MAEPTILDLVREAIKDVRYVRARLSSLMEEPGQIPDDVAVSIGQSTASQCAVVLHGVEVILDDIGSALSEWSAALSGPADRPWAHRSGWSMY